MTASVVNRVLYPVGKGGRNVTLPVAAYHLYAGNMVSQLAAAPGSLCPAGTALSGAAIGVVLHEQDNSTGAVGDLRAEMMTDGIFAFANSVGDPCAETTAFGAQVYVENDYTVSKTNGGSQFVAGYFMGMDPSGRVRVLFSPRELDPADLTILATSAGAGDVGILDAGNFTAQTTVEGALAQIYQHIETGKALLPISLMGALAAGTPLAAFADNAASQPGISLQDTKAFGVRWNDAATQVAVWTSVILPQDLDTASPMVVHVLASKTGATLGDATKFTITMFAQTPAALDDAGADLGGDTSAMVGNATAKTLANLTLSIAVPPTPPAVCSLTIKPKDGTLGTDDVTVFGLWIEYKRKPFTS